MLKLTHGMRSNERVSTTDPTARATAGVPDGAAHGDLGRATSALDYRDLRGLAAARTNAHGDWSERFGRARTLEAGWIFGGEDSMNGPRARLAGLSTRSCGV